MQHLDAVLLAHQIIPGSQNEKERTGVEWHHQRAKCFPSTAAFVEGVLVHMHIPTKVGRTWRSPPSQNSLDVQHWEVK